MTNLIKNILRSGISKLAPPDDSRSKNSYSQCGEDLIVAYIFSAINYPMLSYLDIGAHHPYKLSNTAYYYKQGCRGINVEPDPVLFNKLRKARPEDINLNIGIRNFVGVADFYILSTSTLNTFSKAEAEQLAKEHGYQIKEVKQIHVDTLPNIINRYAGGEFPDFLSLDVEGLDIEILESIDYSKSLPKVICVETISYSKIGQGEKNYEVIEFLESKGYMVYADTYINTIFVQSAIWKR